MRLRLETFSPASVARALCAEIGLKEDIQAGATSNQAAARRWGNVEGLINVFFRREEKGKGDRESFAEFLRLLALRQDGDEEDATDRVTLTTIHGAKGLEWRHVFLIGLEEGLMPHARTIDERATDAMPVHDGGDPRTPGGDAATSLEEERRLFYVAVTRARDRLFMSRVKVRGMRGKPVPRTPSRFLLEIPPALYDEREEEAAVAPDLEKARAGAAGVLAAILGEGGGTGEIAPIRRPFAPPRRRR
jgi:ATP-dependent DNA helicase Rep